MTSSLTAAYRRKHFIIPATVAVLMAMTWHWFTVPACAQLLPVSNNSWDLRVNQIHRIVIPVFDDEASTPEDVAAAQDAFIQEMQNLPHDAKELLLGKLVNFVVEGMPTELVADDLADLIGEIVDRSVPERTRPSHQDRLNALAKQLEGRLPGDTIPLALIGAVVTELISPALAQTTALENAVRSLVAWGRVLDANKRLNREPVISVPKLVRDAIAAREEVQAASAEDMQQVRDLLNEISNHVQAEAIRRAQAQSREQQRKREEEARKPQRETRHTTGPSAPAAPVSPSFGGSSGASSSSNQSSGGSSSSSSSAANSSGSFNGNITIGNVGRDGVRYSTSPSPGYYTKSAAPKPSYQGGGYSGGGIGYGMFGYYINGGFIASEGEPTDVPVEDAQQFQQAHVAVVGEGKPSPSNPGPLETDASQRPDRTAASYWKLPSEIAGCSAQPVAPVVRKLYPGVPMQTFAYYAAGSSDPIAFTFAADTSANLTPFPSSIATCTHTTFGAEVVDVSEHHGLLLYEFRKIAPEGTLTFFGAQWLIVARDEQVTMTNPMLPVHQKYEVGSQLFTYQVLSPNLATVRDVFHQVVAEWDAEHLVKRPRATLPKTWIKDASVQRDRLNVKIHRRHSAGAVKLNVRMWPRTYSVNAGTGLDYQVPLMQGDNYLTLQLPWFPGACSVELSDGKSKSLAFLQREVVPLGTTHIADTIGAEHLRPKALPLLAKSRGVLLAGQKPQVYLPLASVKQRQVDLRQTTGLVVDVELATPATLQLTLQTDLLRNDRDGPQATVQLGAGHHTLELPWSKFDDRPTSGFGVFLSLQPRGAKSMEARLRQLAVVHTHELGTQFQLGTFDLVLEQPPESAIFSVKQAINRPFRPAWLPTWRGKTSGNLTWGARLWLSEPSGTCRPAVAFRKRTDVTGRRQRSAEDSGLRLGQLSSHVFRGGWETLRLYSTKNQWRCALPEVRSASGVSVELHPLAPSRRSGSEGLGHALAVSLLVASGLLWWRGFARWKTASFVIGALLAEMTTLYQPAAPTVAPLENPTCYAELPPLRLLKRTGQQRPFLTIGPTLIDPIAPAPNMTIGGGVRPVADVERTVFADFAGGRTTAFGGSVGGFASPGAQCSAECIRTTRGGKSTSVLKVTGTAPPDGYLGVWFANRRPRGMSFRSYRTLQFSAQAQGRAAVWDLELKGNGAILGSCQIAAPPGEWHDFQVPLSELLSIESADLVDEIVFKFGEQTTSVLIDSVCLVP